MPLVFQLDSGIVKAAAAGDSLVCLTTDGSIRRARPMVNGRPSLSHQYLSWFPRLSSHFLLPTPHPLPFSFSPPPENLEALDLTTVSAPPTIISRLFNFMPGLGGSSRSTTGASAAYSDASGGKAQTVHLAAAALEDGSTVTAIASSSGQLRLIRSALDHDQSVTIFERSGRELLAAALEATSLSQVTIDATATKVAILPGAVSRHTLRPGLLLAVFFSDTSQSPEEAESGVAAAAEGRVIVFYLPLAADYRSIDPELLCTKSSLPAKITSLALTGTKVLVLADDPATAMPTLYTAELVRPSAAAAGIVPSLRLWQTTALLPLHLAGSGPILPDHLDPRSVFTDYLFRGQRFSVWSLRRALTLYTRTRGGHHADASAFSLSMLAGEDAASAVDQLSGADLEREVILAVEQAICSATLELSADEYRQSEQRCWQGFLQAAMEFEEELLRPLTACAFAAAAPQHGQLQSPEDVPPSQTVFVVCALGPSLLLQADPIENFQLESTHSAHELRADFPRLQHSQCRSLAILLDTVNSVGALLDPLLGLDWRLRPLESAQANAAALLDGTLVSSTLAANDMGASAEAGGEVIDVAQNLWSLLGAVVDLPTTAALLLQLLAAPEPVTLPPTLEATAKGCLPLFGQEGLELVAR